MSVYISCCGYRGAYVDESHCALPHLLPEDIAELQDKGELGRSGEFEALEHLLDSSSIIGNTVTFGTEVLDVAEDLVRAGAGVEGCGALVLDVLHPERSTSGGGSGS